MEPITIDTKHTTLAHRLQTTGPDTFGGRTWRAAQVVEAAITLGLSIPKSVHEAAAQASTVQERVRSWGEAVPVPNLTPADLAADDWADRLAAAASAAAARDKAQGIAQDALKAARNDVGVAANNAIPQIADALEAWFVAHVNELALVGTTNLDETVRATQVREDTAAAFTRAHTALMTHGGGENLLHSGAFGDRDAWWATHTWTPKQWSQLVANTRPGMTAVGNPLATAVRLGATPRLARSYRQPSQDREAVLDYREQRLASIG